MSNMCKVKNNNITCFKIRDNKYQNEIFEKKSKELVIKYYQEIEEGKRIHIVHQFMMRNL